MELKRILNFIFGLIIVMFVANAANYYDSYHMVFTNDKPNNMQIQTFRCEDASCSVATPIIADYYKGDAVSCWSDYGAKGDEAGYLSCMEDYKLVGNTLNLNDPDTISDGSSGDVYMYAKLDTNVSFGYVSYFFTQGDTYMANYQWTTNFNCEYDTCVDLTPVDVEFLKGGTAIAEVGQVNIKNVDNPLLPVQVEVPVQIEESVCSAYSFTQPDMYKPIPPAGYSDFSANTKVNLTITNEDNGGQELYFQEITIPILADTCAGLAAFSWTADASLENTDVKFRIETEVVDDQVTDSLVDWAENIETVYPTDLDGACWTRAYDFTLSNIPSSELSTSVATIIRGESLYAIFDAAAFRDEAQTPMGYDVNLYFDNNLIYSNTFQSNVDVQRHVIDLTNEISGLPTGSYEVKLVTSPNGAGCTISEDVVQTQNLQILNPAQVKVRFHVRDPNFNPLSSANVNLVLLDATDYYVTDPVYNENILTDSNGLAEFDNVILGDYRYVVTSSNYETVINNVHIGGPTDIYVTLASGNTAPVIDLPASFTQYYKDPIEFDVRDYVMDFNDDLASLDVDYSVVSGSLDVDLTSNRYFSITDDAPSTNTLEITVTDPFGASDTDRVDLIFIDNQAPIITRFVATPNDGPMPFNPQFVIEVSDADDDPLTCTIDFGDGTSTQNTCSALNGISHRYPLPGSYVVTLTASDGFNEDVEATEMIYVYEKTPTPIINYFRLASTNDVLLPTNLTLSWDVEHNEGYPITCELRVNGVANAVPCAAQTYDITNFNVEGTSRFVLVATDNESNQETRIIEQGFGYIDGPAPVIDSFNLASSNGIVVPTNLTLSWTTHHTRGLPMTCTLNVNGVVSAVACDGVQVIQNFNTLGTSNFILTAIDNESRQAVDTITQTFYDQGDIDLDNVDTQLIIDSVVEPGEFEFGLRTGNETLARRFIYVKPIIEYHGAEIELESINKNLDSSAVSSNVNDAYVYGFKSNTLAYEALIPKDVPVTFKLELTDDYSSLVTLEKTVTFSYPEEEQVFASIRGKGTDITEFMASTLSSGGIESGYNSVKFNVVNNEDVGKDISISMISQSLDIEYKTDINLGVGDTRAVTMPLFISEDVKPGMYPVRYTVRDGTDTQSRYSYILVK